MNYYEIEKALYNVTSYGDFEEFAESTFLVDYTETDFMHDIERGAYSEITRGTYNGATDTFTPWTLSNESLFDTILSEINESDFYSMFYEDEAVERVKAYTNADWVEEYCTFYDVFTIGNHVYIHN
ncbi:hypothetical protein [Macrococcus capreoli]|uniref:hypothetical protein n=1 Tax=Macrococcus capreoli TaxID=2982690 RepID=UPI0021D61271|nr:hypothetical protein [Macrococcus sp. TMW 2.2395]MCU7556547.1 hypothetical protein [Macrococcus sp. TMW 2.2395]